ncbi:MAG TPA: hypothetical protein VD835_17215 [Pyrinomonadaceae bacterium]|nr:hypothetical protein [Pyrinomonadaceae bacterium]
MNKREHAATVARTRASRRQFAKTVAGAFVAAPLIARTTVNAQTPPATKQAPAPPNPQPTPPPQAAPPPSPVAEAYAEIGRLRFGDKLTPDELERMKRDMEGNVRTAERLRPFKLKNADEPDFIFIA